MSLGVEIWNARWRWKPLSSVEVPVVEAASPALELAPSPLLSVLTDYCQCRGENWESLVLFNF